MEKEIQELRKEVAAIKVRNARVEADKDWETSLYRRVSIAVITYLVVLVFMLVTKAQNPFTNSLVPALAYLLGNISIGILKSWWLKRRKA
ncbi:MAG: hypothetical protein Q7S79_03450 [bacterium]|nr:hypothetical protein [bacterium]